MPKKAQRNPQKSKVTIKKKSKPKPINEELEGHSIFFKIGVVFGVLFFLILFGTLGLAVIIAYLLIKRSKNKD